MRKITDRLVDQSIGHILQHLGEPLTVKDLAEHFHYSESNFSRRFKAATGESVYAFIKRIKMDQSAVDLKLRPDRSITDIGLEHGYSPSNYSSAFKKHRAASPNRFRKQIRGGSVENPFFPGRIETFEPYDFYRARIRIEALPDISARYVRSLGSLLDLKAEWTRIIHDHGACLDGGACLLERFYSDPSITGQTGCLCDLCVTAGPDCGLGAITSIKGGRFAVYRYEGEIEHIFRAVQGVFSVWLPQSGCVMRETYGLNLYRAVDLDSEFVVMDLCIPIK